MSHPRLKQNPRRPTAAPIGDHLQIGGVSIAVMKSPPRVRGVWRPTLFPFHRPSSVRRANPSALPAAGALLAGCLAFGVLFTDLLAPLYVKGPPAGATEAAFRRDLDRQIPLILDRYRVPGVVIGTIVHGDPGQIYAYGVADKSRGTPMTGRTVFPVASLAKAVTAWGVMTLVDAGKIDLDQPAERYLAHWPLAVSKFPSGAVTVRQLLTHTAGVNGGDDEFRRPDERPADPAELLGRSGPMVSGRRGQATLVAPAGRTFLYSPAGYTLLQMLIEQQTGRPFADYMRDAVLGPLGMTSSTYQWTAAPPRAVATPYLSDGASQPVRLAQDVAADGLFSTAEDLVRFVAAPVAGQDLPVGAGVISDRTARELFLRPPRFSRSDMAILGADAPCLGCFIEQSAGGPVVISGVGADPGGSMEFHAVPSTGDGLVVLTNSSHSELAIAEIDALWAGWRGLPPPQTVRSFRTLIGPAIAVVSVVSAAVIVIAFSCLGGVLAGRRRFADFNAHAGLESLFDLALVGAAAYGWFLWRETVAEAPALAVVLKANLAVMVAVATGRLLFPRDRTAAGARPAPTRRRVAARAAGQALASDEA